MKKPKTYIFHSDAGHGWLAVKRKELVNLGIIDNISSCSYERGSTVYLEEDCDAGIFLDALKSKGFEENIEYKIREGASVDRSPIRSYKLFVPNPRSML